MLGYIIFRCMHMQASILEIIEPFFAHPECIQDE